MARGVRVTECRGCNRPIEECGTLSLAYLCEDCGNARFEANTRQLNAHSGPYFDWWRLRCIQAFGGFVTVRDDDEQI